MAGQKPTLHAVDQILDFTVDQGQQPPAADRTARRGPKRAAAGTGVRKPLVIPELREAYREITSHKAVGGLAKTTYFTEEEFERIQRAAYHLGGIPAGVLSHYGAIFFLEQLEDKNGGPFAPIPHRG